MTKHVTNSETRPVIKIEGLHHSYGKINAVNGIDITVPYGKIYSLLGPNGAGKSTTINIMTTLLPLQKGKVTIASHDRATQENEVRQAIGIVFQGETLDGDMTVWETLEFQGWIYSMPKEERHSRIDELLQVVCLEEKRDILVKKLSGGMKRRLEIARGLITRPKVLFLDEPTVGLDPQARYHIWDYIRKVREEGVTIFLTTHYMDEADQLSDHIYIMDEGKIITEGTSDELKNTIGRDMVYVTTPDNDSMINILKNIEGVVDVRPSTKGLVVTLDVEGESSLPVIFEKAKEAEISISRISLVRPTLDDVFVHYTGRSLREEGGVTSGINTKPDSDEKVIIVEGGEA